MEIPLKVHLEEASMGELIRAIGVLSFEIWNRAWPAFVVFAMLFFLSKWYGESNED